MKNGIRWLVLLNKRLWKKPTFLVLLLLIPLLTVCYTQTTRQEPGLVSVALAQEAPDPLAETFIEELLQASGMVRFRVCEAPDEAIELVQTGDTDLAWIFPGNLQSKIEAFVRTPSRDQAFIRVYQREDNVLLMLTREILGGQLYRSSSKSLYLQALRELLPEAQTLSDETLLAHYGAVDAPDTLFFFTQEGYVPNTGHLTAPIRGILAVVVMLGSLAAALYHMEDLSAGTFAWLRQDRLVLAELAGQLLTTVNLALVSLVALCLSGLSGPLGRELLLWGGLCLCGSSFSMMLRRLCGHPGVLGALMPLLAVGLLVLCPVFFDTSLLNPLPWLLPPTYCIRGLQDSRILWYVPLYSLGCILVYLLPFQKAR